VAIAPHWQKVLKLNSVASIQVADQGYTADATPQTLRFYGVLLEGHSVYVCPDTVVSNDPIALIVVAMLRPPIPDLKNVRDSLEKETARHMLFAEFDVLNRLRTQIIKAGIAGHFVGLVRRLCLLPNLLVKLCLYFCLVMFVENATLA